MGKRRKREGAYFVDAFKDAFVDALLLLLLIFRINVYFRIQTHGAEVLGLKIPTPKGSWVGAVLCHILCLDKIYSRSVLLMLVISKPPESTMVESWQELRSTCKCNWQLYY